jgi:CRP/FNR family transcriptional regulator
VTATYDLDGSFLATVEPPVVDAIRQRAVVYTHRSGDMVMSDAETRWTGIVLSGMARVFLRTPAGRQVTLRHAQPTSSIGIGALLGEGAVSAQAVTACSVLRLDTAHLVRTAERNPSLAMAIAREVSARLIETYHEIVIREQGSLRQRLARQLLNFAGEMPTPERPLVLPLSHEDVADAVGSAREVVSRHLERFQAEEMLALERGQITLVDPVRLDQTARQMG